MDTNLVFEGTKFMVLGMGTVFLFLVLMIVAINAMSMVIHKFFPEPEGTASATPSTPAKSNVSAKVAAITAAIMHHKQNS